MWISYQKKTSTEVRKREAKGKRKRRQFKANIKALIAGDGAFLSRNFTRSAVVCLIVVFRLLCGRIRTFEMNFKMNVLLMLFLRKHCFSGDRERVNL